MQEEHRMIARAEIERRIRSRLELQNALVEDMEYKRRRREQEQREEEVIANFQMLGVCAPFFHSLRGPAFQWFISVQGLWPFTWTLFCSLIRIFPFHHNPLAIPSSDA